MKKYSKKWLLKYEPNILCENLEQRTKVIAVLERMGFKKYSYIMQTELVVFASNSQEYETYDLQDIDSHTTPAADFIAANPGKGGARIKTNYKAKLDLRRSYRISISDNECKALTAKYGSLTKAIRTLLLAGK